MARANSFGLIRALIMETSFRTTFTVKVSIVGLMVVFTMGSGSTIRWRAKALSLGVMAGDTKATTRMIRSMVMAPLSGQMAESTSVSGVKVNNTVKESTSKRAKRDKVSGRWARESSGLKISQEPLPKNE